MKTPAFWDKSSSLWATLLKPLGMLYTLGGVYRFSHARPYQVDIPVICVGNLSVGGTGKTPVCLAIARQIYRQKKTLFFLNHGYKSRLKNVQVDLNQHQAYDVGDEAILFAHYAPTIVDNKRARGAQLCVKRGAKCIVMDDGFQNPSLIKSYSFIVVDGKKGFANECVLPAGPLREPVLNGLKRADAIIIVGDDEWGVRFYLQRHKIDLPILTGRFELNKRHITALKNKNVCAFAGIGQPEKFYNALKAHGINPVITQSYPDHYFYTRFDIEELFKKANGAPLLTTTKDAVKIPADLLQKIDIIDGDFVFDDEKQIQDILKGII